MKAIFYFIKREFVSAILVLISSIPMFFMGSLLDILLTHFYAHSESGKTWLPAISQWVYHSIAGHRFLPQEIMACIWICLVILFILNAFFAKDQQQFRIRFIYSFLFTWILTIASATFIVFACVIPFDLLLSRLDEGMFDRIIHAILIFELIIVVLIPIGLVIWNKTSKTRVKTGMNI